MQSNILHPAGARPRQRERICVLQWFCTLTARLYAGVATGGGAWWQDGKFLMLGAAQCMAAGTLMVPWVTRDNDPVMATGWHMVFGSVPLIALSLLTERAELTERLSQVTPGASPLTHTLKCRTRLEGAVAGTMRCAAAPLGRPWSYYAHPTPALFCSGFAGMPSERRTRILALGSAMVPQHRMSPDLSASHTQWTLPR
jgi:hypothetical protein